MKKLLLLPLVALVLSVTLPTQAAVPRTDALNIVTAGIWTNPVAGSPLKVLLVQAYNANAPTGTVTLTRLAGNRTNSVGAITLSAGAGLLSVTGDIYVEQGDRLRAVLSGGATNVDLEITGVEATVRRSALNVITSNSWTSTYGFQGQKLLTIEAFNGNLATGTVTLTRMRAARTNALGSITLSSGAGTVTVTTNNVWLWPGDKITALLSGGATNVDLEFTMDLGL